MPGIELEESGHAPHNWEKGWSCTDLVGGESWGRWEGDQEAHLALCSCRLPRTGRYSGGVPIPLPAGTLWSHHCGKGSPLVLCATCP